MRQAQEATTRTLTSPNPSHTALKHVGIIPDGNRRWAKQHEMKLGPAYWLAAQKIAMCIDRLFEHGVSSVSTFLLSKDNVLRPRDDLEAVIHAELRLLQELLPPLKVKRKLKIYHAGTPGLLTNEYQSALRAICQTDNGANDDFPRVYLCAGYDPFEELVSALNDKSLDAESVINHLSVPITLDAVVRTGGDLRISGFLPLQCKYAEFFFEPYYFPDISKQNIDKIVGEFASRSRRFGR